ncbi:MAG: nitroreductase family protein, partial [Actinobacteria bacterium]|nr:nitroreductase family protein [Actinomycetota bacterium]
MPLAGGASRGRRRLADRWNLLHGSLPRRSSLRYALAVTCNPRHRPVPAPSREVPAGEALEAARRFREVMSTRRSIRDFSDRPVSRELIDQAIATAHTAPSGANRQPWRFVVVTDPETKRRIREGAELEEREFYESGRATEWLEALEPLGTDWHKPFLEVAPYLIVVFEVHRGAGEPKPYYVKESVGIAVGFLLASLHQAGLATLTHTPSPMRFLNEILDRPPNERPFAVIPVG